jgi:ribosomal protein S15P/S13E
MTEEKVKKTKKKAEKKEAKKLEEKEYEKQVLDLAEKGLTSEKIGETLRKEGIHSKEYIKSISKILKENKVYVNPDSKNISEKLEKIKLHYKGNKQDKRAKREIDRLSSQLRKLKIFFKEN